MKLISSIDKELDEIYDSYSNDENTRKNIIKKVKALNKKYALDFEVDFIDKSISINSKFIQSMQSNLEALFRKIDLSKIGNSEARLGLTVTVDRSKLYANLKRVNCDLSIVNNDIYVEFKKPKLFAISVI